MKWIPAISMPGSTRPLKLTFLFVMIGVVIFSSWAAPEVHASEVWVALGSIGLAAGLDELADEWAMVHAPEGSWLFSAGRTWSDLSLAIVPMIVGGMMAADRTTGEQALTSVGYATIMTLSLKVASGRGRPLHDEGPHFFSPMSFDDHHHSFPSGHAAVAFALAASIADSYPQWAGLGYAAAAGVAFSRVVVREHWASDAVFGAVMGYAIGKGVASGTLPIVEWKW